jgi:hypothetical protein
MQQGADNDNDNDNDTPEIPPKTTRPQVIVHEAFLRERFPSWRTPETIHRGFLLEDNTVYVPSTWTEKNPARFPFVQYDAWLRARGTTAAEFNLRLPDLSLQDWLVDTEKLETELKELSTRIAADPLRFQQVRDELKRRREIKDEQPPPETTEQASERTRSYEQKLSDNLALKVTMMEAEQAKLVVELEIAREAQRVAEERLALVVKHIPAKREPVSTDTAYKYALTHMNKASLFGEPPPWAIDAIVEVSR